MSNTVKKVVASDSQKAWLSKLNWSKAVPTKYSSFTMSFTATHNHKDKGKGEFFKLFNPDTEDFKVVIKYPEAKETINVYSNEKLSKRY